MKYRDRYHIEYRNLSESDLNAELTLVKAMRGQYREDLEQWIEVGNESQSARYARRLAAQVNRINAIEDLLAKFSNMAYIV